MLAFYIVIGYLALALFAYLVSDSMIFQPPPASYGTGSGVTQLRTASGTRIAVVHVPNPDARFTLLFSHGNAEDVGQNQPYFRLLREAGFAVLAYEYPGYGPSQGRPSEKGAYEAADAAYDHLTRELGVPSERIIMLGRSLGAAAALYLAARRPVGGVVLESPFVTAFRVLTRVPIFPFDKFDNLSRIGRVRAPLLIIHGTADSVVPTWHGRRLFQAAPEPKQAWWVEGADHNDLMLVAGKAYFERLREFANEVASRQEGAGSGGS